MPTIINGYSVPDQLNIRVLAGSTADITIPVLVTEDGADPAAYDFTGHTLRCQVRSRTDGTLIADLVEEGWLTIEDATAGYLRLLIPATADLSAPALTARVVPFGGGVAVPEAEHVWGASAVNPSGRVAALWEGRFYARAEVSG